MQSVSPVISIVMPVFNGGKYLDETLQSILAQDFLAFEVICVNDSSTDNSLQIIESYSKIDTRVICITTEQNLGMVPKVLNYATPFIRGDYFVYTSQDDLFSKDWLQEMHKTAVLANADAVLPNMSFYYEEKLSTNNLKLWKGLHGNKSKTLSNKEAVLHSLEWDIHGFALWNTRLIRDFGYEDFGMYADEYTTRIFFLNSNKIVFSEGMFYYRQDNPIAITKNFSFKLFDKPYTHYMLFCLLRKNLFDKNTYQEELGKSIDGLIDYRLDLARRKKTLSTEFSKEADSRLLQCFTALKGEGFSVLMAQQKGLKRNLRCLLLVADYNSFKIISLLFLMPGLIRSIKVKMKSWLPNAVLHYTK